MEQLRDAPVEEDVDEDEKTVGNSDGEEVGNMAAECEQLHACCEGGVSVDDLLNTAEARSAPVNQKHVQAEAGVNGGRDVDGAKFNQWVIPSSAQLDREGPADRQCLLCVRLGLWNEEYTRSRRLSPAIIDKVSRESRD